MVDDIKKAINEKRLVEVTFNSFEKGEITRKCVPFDIGPSKRCKDGKDRFHFWDLECPTGENHNLSILPEQILNLNLSEEVFDPADYVTWEKIEWHVPRDWGSYS